VGERRSKRQRRTTTKISAVIGEDHDHPNDYQTRQSPNAAEWAQARRKEREQLHKYGVFTKIVKEDIPEGTKIVDTKWVYVIKRKLDGSIEKYKARKVGRGFTQQDGINYDSDKTYAQMIRPETLKILLVLAMQKDWSIRQWDVVAAYLQALLHHDVYISDVNENGETEFWKLNKALYGLKQAGHEWYKTLQKILAIIGLHQCTGDEGTYINKEKNIIIGTHVDDLVGIAPNNDILDTVQHKAEQHIELEIRGRPTKLLGMEVLWNEDGTEAIMTQQTLIESMATKYLSEQITRKNSLPLNPDLYQEGEELLKDPKEYQSITGGLLFIARMTRPDISFHVNLFRAKSSKTVRVKLQSSNRDPTTPRYHKIIRDCPTKTNPPKTQYLHRCFLRRRRGQIPDRHSYDTRGPAYRLV